MKRRLSDSNGLQDPIDKIGMRKEEDGVEFFFFSGAVATIQVYNIFVSIYREVAVAFPGDTHRPPPKLRTR